MTRLLIDPTHERALSNFNFFSKQMKEDPEAFNRVVTEQTRNVYPETLGYEELCREAKPIVSSVSGCEYLRSTEVQSVLST